MKNFRIYNNKSIALVTVLILIITLVILAVAMLTLLSSQVRLIEHGASRTESRYADEATMVRQLEHLRKGLAIEDSHVVSGVNVTITHVIGAGLDQTDELNLTQDYSVIF